MTGRDGDDASARRRGPLHVVLSEASFADAGLPLAQTIEIALPKHVGPETVDVSATDPLDFSDETGAHARTRLDSSGETARPTAHPTIAPGEALQLVRFAKRDSVLLISGLTPHGRRLTFEQRSDRDGWYVVAAGRRRRPTERELGLVVASITQEMEAAMAPEGESEVRSAYRLASASDQPGMPIKGLQAYRDILLDEAAAYAADQTERLAVVAIEYQAFKRFAIRHGHRIGAAFVRALGERLHELFGDERMLHVFHKFGKSFRLIVINRSAAETRELVNLLTTDATKEWLVNRVWGDDRRTHPDEVNFYIGIAKANPSERTSEYETLAQRLNDDAYRAAKLGQLKGHTSIVIATSDYRTTLEQWLISSEDELEDLASQMDDGPAAVMAEMCDYLHELVPADLEGMAVDGDLHALVHKAIARDGFWQGTTAMRIAGERLVKRLLEQNPTPEGELNSVGGFDLGDEFYGIAIEKDTFYFAWGDLNSAGATRVRAGLQRVQNAVGWRAEHGGGIVGRFLSAVADCESAVALPGRIRDAAEHAFVEVYADENLHINDAVDIADFLWTQGNEPVRSEDIVEGAKLVLSLPSANHKVEVLDRRTGFILLLSIDGVERPAAVSDSITGPQVKLRIRNTVVSAAVCILEMRREDLEDVLSIVREDNNLPDDTPMDVVGFLRHIADVLLAEYVKAPAKVGLALGDRYSAQRFVGVYTLEEVRERHPGLFYEAVHHYLLQAQPPDIDRQLCEVIGHNMLRSTRPAT